MTKIDMAPARAFDQGAPIFTGSSVWGASPEKPLLYRVPVLGQRPLTLYAEALPDGVTLDAGSGILTGRAAAGEYAVTLRAENVLGAAVKKLTLRIAPDGACRTPLMGFTSWNAFGPDVTQERIFESARLMDEIGLADFGYQYVNIDSGWQGEYGGKLNAIQPNAKFSDMRALADAIHARGMKIGIYSTPMQKAWGGYEYPGCTRGKMDPAYMSTYYGVGMEHMEKQNAAQWAEWTIDYLKYDWSPCDTHNASLMKDALSEQPRDIPMCVTVAAGKESAEWWRTNCCSWRDNGDSFGEWKNVRTRFDSDDWSAHIGAGHYFDHDMLETGVTVWHAQHLTEDEQVIAYSLRALFPSPLQISCDLTKLTAFDRALLMNEEVIGVNQDALSTGAVCVLEKRTRDADREVRCDLKLYVRPLENGDMALGMFNLGATDEEVCWPVRGKGVRDLWAKKDVAVDDVRLVLSLEPHTARLFRIRELA